MPNTFSPNEFSWYRPRSVWVPIVMMITALALIIALLIGWTLQWVATGEVSRSVWLLVLGIISFVVLMTVVVFFSVELVREIREGRRQKNFIDSVTHELKTPLASIRLFAETLSRKGLKESQRTELLGMMLIDVDRLSSFIDDILDASRAQELQDMMSFFMVPLEEIVWESVEAIERRHKLPGDTLSVELSSPDLELETDRTALATVLKNLLDNAIKYSDDPSSVRLSAFLLADDSLCIEVSDTGIGIEGDDLELIFDRFYRSPTEAVRSRRGTGLGLYVVAALIRHLGGHIEVRSPGLNQGSTMTVTLPLSPHQKKKLHRGSTS